MKDHIREYFDVLEDLRLIQRRLIYKANAFHAVHLDGIADDLEGIAADLDAAVDRLMDNSEAEPPQRVEILSAHLQDRIREDEAAA